MIERRLVSLSDGIYTVPQVCRIIGPRMTSRRVHYWLDTGLISGPPVEHGRKGVPTLLTFRQLMEIRTVQHLRDEVNVQLKAVRDAFEWILRHVFEDGEAVRFERGGGSAIIARTEDDSCEVIPWGQGAFDFDVPAMNADLAVSRQAWLEKRLRIRGHVVTDTHVLAGSPTVEGTRIETSIIATFADDERYDAEDLAAVISDYPDLAPEAVKDAFEYEGISAAA